MKNNSKWENFIRDELLPALRSGEYTKGMHRLYNPEEDSYCCLGVVCDILEKEHGLDIDWRGMKVLPFGVVSYFGETIAQNPSIRKATPSTAPITLSLANDAAGRDGYKKVIKLLEAAIDPNRPDVWLGVNEGG